MALRGQQTQLPAAPPDGGLAGELLQLTSAAEQAAGGTAVTALPPGAAQGAEAGGAAPHLASDKTPAISGTDDEAQRPPALPSTGPANGDFAAALEAPAVLPVSGSVCGAPQPSADATSVNVIAFAPDTLQPNTEEPASSEIVPIASTVDEQRTADGSQEAAGVISVPGACIVGASGATPVEPVSEPPTSGADAAANVPGDALFGTGQAEAERPDASGRTAAAEEAGPDAEGRAGGEAPTGAAVAVEPAEAGAVGQHTEVS